MRLSVGELAALSARSTSDALERRHLEQILLFGCTEAADWDVSFRAPTPTPCIAALVDAAELRPHLRVLEPSAGAGRLCAALLEREPTLDLWAYERELRYRDELLATCAVVQIGDFLDLTPRPMFHRVVMSPPFGWEGGADYLEHIRHAHRQLGVGGRVVALVPAGVRWRLDDRHLAFRTWLAAIAGELDDVPAMECKGAEDGVAVCVLRISR